MPIIAPSILASDFANLQKEAEMINQSAADWFHIDVMDGVFVPNISFGIPVTEAIKKHANKPLDVHLMIVNPEKYIEDFAKAGADLITVHWEACPHIHRTLAQIKEAGCKAGVVLNPATPVSVLQDIISDCDMVLLMSVNPGFGGQKFIENTYQKVKELKKLILQKNAETIIEIDGGVNLETGAKLVEAGADALVAGSFVFNHQNPLEIISKLKSL
ncbi:MAG: ribulose-phosphate 3-epimerase [Cytophagaceae bacterium]|nr:ribulose-phosphate 3-epimerase [Cytophagaceae bacterium]MBL0327225.1 ribulose-phosphate 3-epimerase [Cytophagaceae bacterium]